jgi:hypothetical protein
MAVARRVARSKRDRNVVVEAKPLKVRARAGRIHVGYTSAAKRLSLTCFGQFSRAAKRVLQGASATSTALNSAFATEATLH